MRLTKEKQCSNTLFDAKGLLDVNIAVVMSGEIKSTHQARSHLVCNAN